MPVSIASNRRLRGVTAKAVARDATALLHHLTLDHSELSIALVSDAEIRHLNATYRHKDQPTDVLAFAMREGADGLHPEVLGDVVISLDTAARQAAARGVPVADEVRLLLTHGLLHLLGYDHERSPAEARRMFGKQRALKAALDARDPTPR
ncbi:MAG: rRNA maturation RNase YbeY [Candidatus Binatia bacterium]